MANTSPTALTRTGPPAELSVISGDAQSGTVGLELSQPLVVKAVDASGRAVQGQVVNFRVTAGGGSVFAGSANTNAEGIAQERWTLGTTAGDDQTVEARAVDSNTVAARLCHIPRYRLGRIRLRACNPNTARSLGEGGPTLSPQPIVRLVDRFGNAVRQSGVTVSASISPVSGHTLAGNATAQTDNAGVATFSELAPSGAAGAVTLSFASPNLTSIGSSAITLSAGAPASIVALTPLTLPSTVVGAPVAAPLPAVAVRDAAGNGVVGVSVSFGGAGQISPSSTATDDSGVATISSWTMPTTPGTYTLTASVAAVTGSPLAFVITARQASASRLTAISPTEVTNTVGAVVPLMVRVADTFGNAVGEANVSWSLAGGGVQLSSSSSASDADGKAQVTASLPSTPGRSNVVASLAGGPSVMFSIISTIGGATKLIAVTGTSASGDVATNLPTFWVKATDDLGNPVPGVTVTFTGSPGSNWSSNSMSTDGQGQAGFTWTLPKAVGTYTVSASATALSGSPIVFTGIATPAAATHIAILSGNGFTDTVGKATPPLVVRVTDDYGNFVPGASVTWRATTQSGGGAPTLSTAPSVTDIDGVTQIGATLQTRTGSKNTGTANVIASLASGASATFALTAIAGPAASIETYAGDGQSAAPGTTLPIPIVVTVYDRYHNPTISPVSFVITSGGGNLSLTSQASDQGGIASTSWTLGSSTGTQKLTASAGGSSLTFTATALALQLSIVQQPPTSAEATFVLNPAPVVRLVDGFGQSVSRNGMPITVTVPAPWVVSGVTTMPTTGDGVATFKIAIAGPAEPVQLSFTSPGITAVTSAAVAMTSQRPMSLSWNYADGSNNPAGSYLIER